jgi:hypothetical protein
MGVALEVGPTVIRAALLLMMLSMSAATQAATYAIVIAGLGGEAEYEKQFRSHATALSEALAHLDDEAQVMLLIGNQAQAAALRRELQAIAGKSQSGDRFILMMVGHGTFDGEEFRFNVPGPDITASDLAAQLNRINAGEQLVVVASSASGGVLQRLQRPGRVVVTATKSGSERNATRFAEFWVRALTTAEADVDKDEWVTIKEAFEYAERKVADAYKSSAALATEHARLQETDSTRAERIPIARLGEGRAMPTDPQLRGLITERLRIEREVDAVKARKAQQSDTVTEDQYYDELEKVLVELAKTQVQIDARQAVLETAGGSRS